MMNKKQALAIIRKRRGRGRPSKSDSERIKQAKKLLKISHKEEVFIKSGKSKKKQGRARHMLKTKKRGRPSLAWKAKLRLARKVIAQNPDEDESFEEVCLTCGGNDKECVACRKTLNKEEI